MKLEGIHHITAITADAPGNVEFYTSVLGLRMVKRTVNQDEPNVYHLFYGDEHGSPGADLTFFEYPGAARGIAGAGMVHRIIWRVSGTEALEFWRDRLDVDGTSSELNRASLLFSDPEGLEHELVPTGTDDAPLSANAPDIPSEYALQGFDGVRAYTTDPVRSEQLLGDTLGFVRGNGERWEARGERRGSFYAYDAPPAEINKSQGAGTVHHVAFAAQPDDFAAWAGADGAAFLPRATFGAYVTARFAEAVAASTAKVRIVRGEAVGVDDRCVTLSDGTELAADAVEQCTQRRMCDPATDDLVEDLSGDASRRLVDTLDLEGALAVVLTRAQRERARETRGRNAAVRAAGVPADRIRGAVSSRSSGAFGQHGHAASQFPALGNRHDQRQGTGSARLTRFEP